jgi:hypothetical protein
VASPQASTFADSLLVIGGETGRMIAGHDWTSTPLGSLEDWPQSLRTALGMVLLSPIPIVMLWGDDGVMLYNDAYSVFAGARHPGFSAAASARGGPRSPSSTKTL